MTSNLTPEQVADLALRAGRYRRELDSMTVEWAYQTKTLRGGEFDRLYATDLLGRPRTRAVVEEEVAQANTVYGPDFARVVSRRVTAWEPGA